MRRLCTSVMPTLPPCPLLPLPPPFIMTPRPPLSAGRLLPAAALPPRPVCRVAAAERAAGAAESLTRRTRAPLVSPWMGPLPNVWLAPAGTAPLALLIPSPVPWSPLPTALPPAAAATGSALCRRTLRRCPTRMEPPCTSSPTPVSLPDMAARCAGSRAATMGLCDVANGEPSRADAADRSVGARSDSMPGSDGITGFGLAAPDAARETAIMDGAAGPMVPAATMLAAPARPPTPATRRSVMPPTLPSPPASSRCMAAAPERSDACTVSRASSSRRRSRSNAACCGSASASSRPSSYVGRSPLPFTNVRPRYVTVMPCVSSPTASRERATAAEAWMVFSSPVDIMRDATFMVSPNRR